jgi:tetratricopeptide (TPR) repeat protein
MAGETAPGSSGAGSASKPTASRSHERTVDATLVDDDRDDAPAVAARTLGRYVLLALIGEGGMGAVYAAYDPELDRKLALKLLRAAADRGARSRERLVREARSMAKLSHPNVVTVHDVGVVDGQVFVAMEFVEGVTLKRWLGTPRARPEILRVFRGAGQGLAAAHAAGLVHRDFKPENVMVDREGRVRVMDFGLARPVSRRPDETTGGGTSQAGAEPTSAEDPGPGITQAGSVLGTPAYMAPEQHLGLPADARSDQFAFCVALFEALFGQRPFRGETRAALALAVTRGTFTEPPAGRVPSRLRRLLRRGLAVEPDRRFPDMPALLAELDRVATRGARRAMLAAAGTAAAFAAAGAMWLGSSRSPCQGAEDELAGVWDQERRAAVEHAFESSGLPYAATTYQGVRARLDAWIGAWARGYTDACEATNVRRDQSPQLMDLRMACLTSHRRAAEELVSVLESADRDVVTHAVAAVDALPDVQACADTTRLGNALAPPNGPDAHAEAESIRGELARAAALAAAGRLDDAAEVAEPLEGRARALAYDPVLAEVLRGRGAILDALGRYEPAQKDLEDAYFLARAIEHDEVGRRAAIELVGLLGTRRILLAEGRAWARHADAEVRRQGGLGQLPEADLRSSVGLLLREAGDSEAALTELEAALEIRRAHLSPDHLDVLAARSNLAVVLDTLGRQQEALEHIRVVLDGRIAQLGADHPDVAESHNNMATALDELGRGEEALAHFRRTLEIREASMGADHPAVGSALSNLGGTLHQMGRYDEAVTALDRAIVVRERALGPEHPDVAASLTNRGSSFEALGRPEEAVADHARALAVLERALGPEHHDVGVAHNNLGTALRQAGREREGVEHLERALEVFRRALGPEHPVLAAALNNLGNAALASGQPEKARDLYTEGIDVLLRSVGERHPNVAYLSTGLGKAKAQLGDRAGAIAAYERSLRILDGQAVAASDAAEAQMALAEVLWSDRSQRARALELARAAEAAYRSGGEGTRAAADDAAAWLRRRGTVFTF